MEFRLREYRAEDFQILWRIDQQCFAPGIAYSQRELAAYIRRKGAFTIVAEQVGEQREASIQGFIVAEARRAMGHIISIDVLPNSQRSGLGSKLLKAVEARLSALQCRNVVLETAVDNIGALAFYKRHHYSLLKTSPRYYSNGVDAFVLGKNLDSARDEALRPS